MALAGPGSPAHAWTGPDRPANYIEIGAKLAASGQPTPDQLGKLKSQGFEVVIYIAPPTVQSAVRDENIIVGRQGLVYVNIPVDFSAPTPADFDAFTRVLASLSDRKVLVHCQVNMRGSVFVFLHRVIHDKQPADRAYELVRNIWVPDPVWRTFLIATLKRHGIAFEPM